MASMMLAGCEPTSSPNSSVSSDLSSSVSSSESSSETSSESSSASSSQTKVTSIVVTAAGGVTSLDVGSQVQLSAAVTGEGEFSEDVFWSIDNPTYATVDNTGLVTGLYKGRVNVTATSLMTKTVFGFYGLEIKFIPVTSVAASLSSSTLFVGENDTHALAKVSDYANPNVTWASSNEAVATIDAQGLITSLAVGTTDITATSIGLDGTGNTITSAAVTLTVKAALPEAAVTTIAALKAITTADNVLYSVTGIIDASSFATKTSGDIYNNGFYLVDPVSLDYIQVYKSALDLHSFSNDAGVVTYTHDAGTPSLDGVLPDGVEVTLYCVAAPYGSTPEINAVPVAAAESEATYSASLNAPANGVASFGDVAQEVVSSVSELAYGDTVTVNVEPAAGYIVDSVTVKNILGASVDATVVEANKTYSFSATCVNQVTVKFMENLDYTKVAAYTFTPAIEGTASTTALTTAAFQTLLTSAADTTTAGLSNIVSGVTAANKVYNAVANYESKGIKLGTSSVDGTFTLTVTDTSIRKVVVSATGWTATDTLKVGDADAQTMGAAYTAPDSEKTLTFNITAATSITFTAHIRAFIRSIEFYSGVAHV